MTQQLPITIAISGASGAIYGIRLLQVLQQLEQKTYLILSDNAEKTITIETDYSMEQVKNLATKVFDNNDMAAAISSGSHKTKGMIIAPCSITTLSSVANSFNHNLIVRAADVCLKEKRKLALMVRETPLHSIHLRNMATLSDMGAIIAPPIPAFYHKPATIDDIIDHSIGKVLDLFDIEHNLFKRWQ